MMTSVDAMTGTVRSADGTTIAFERRGRGPALIFVNAAGCYRDFGSLRPLSNATSLDLVSTVAAPTSSSTARAAPAISRAGRRPSSRRCPTARIAAWSVSGTASPTRIWPRC